MLKGLAFIASCVLLGALNIVFAHEFSTAPILLEPDVDLKYLEDNYFLPPSPGKTNWHRLHTLGLQYGDILRIRTRGTFAVRAPGDNEFGPEAPQPFLGFFTGVVLRPGLYIPAPLQDSGAPEYKTPSIVQGDEVFPTDVPLDFLIPPGGVTLCMPYQGNFLGMLNPDPNVQAKDAEQDFRVEINPIEGARLHSEAILSSPKVTVGDPVALTLTYTNGGNATAYGIRMYDIGYDEMELDTNMVVEVSGPVPPAIPSLPPGGFATIQYSFRTISPGTNSFYARVGLIACDDQFWQGLSRYASLTIEPIIEVNPCRPSAEVYDADSIKAGEEAADLPLRFSGDESALLGAEKFEGGQWIADGVTPLLLRLEIAPDKLDHYPGEATLKVKVKMVSGEIDGTPIQDRLEVFQEGVWTPNGVAKVSKEKPAAFVMLNAVLADELKLEAKKTEVVLRVEVVDHTGLTVGVRQVLLRRPPVVLIHGFNSGGDWATVFTREIAATRGTEFVLNARYGQTWPTSSATGEKVRANTIYPFTRLVQQASDSVDEEIETHPRHRWIFTRYDVVAHSQGGIMARMMSSKRSSNFLKTAFRSEQNFFRGRFHRVVTIGTPYNGTRLLRYIRSLSENPKKGVVIPVAISKQITGSDAAQTRFDPWSDEVAQLNDPSANAPFAPDPAAQFHFVGTYILNGQTYSTAENDAFWALGIDRPEYGAIIDDEGSDGIVDHASMFAKAPKAPLPANGFAVPPSFAIAHAGAVGFGALTNQTDSSLVARHAIDVLDQNQSIPASDRAFSSLKLPQTLPLSIRDAIDELARNFEAKTTTTTASPITPGPRPLADFQASAATRDFTFRINEPAGRPLAGKFYWIPRIYGTNGISPTGVQVRPQGADKRLITLRVNSGVYGDVVFEGIYQSTNDTRVVISPYLAGSLVPTGVTAQKFDVAPGDGALLPAGISLPIEIWTTWSDGRQSLRYSSADRLVVTSSNPEVVDVSDPKNWRTGQPGAATLTTVFEGKTNVTKWSVFDPLAPETPAARLSIARATPSGISLAWPATDNNYQLEAADRLGPAANWQNVPGTPTTVGNNWILDLAATPNSRFYRLRQSP